MVYGGIVKKYISALLLIVSPLWGQTRIDYPSQIRNGPVIIDITYATLLEGCNAAAAAHAVLNVTKQWSNVPTTHCNAVVNFIGSSARIEPANAAIFFANGYTAPSRQQVWLVDTTGVVRITGPGTGSPIFAQNFSTLTSACDTAVVATSTLTVSAPVGTSQIAASFSCAANIYAEAGGIMTPASGQTVTFTGTFDGALTRHIDLSGGGSVAFSSSATAIHAAWYGADMSGSADSTTALVNANAAAVAANIPLDLDSGTYKHSGLSFSGGIQIQGSSQFAAVLRYTGSGTGIALAAPSGFMQNIGIQSTTGHGSAAVGLDIQNSQEFTMTNVAFGGGATSGFTTCMRLRSSGFYFHGGTMSWCDTDVLLDLDSAANIGMRFDDTVFFQSSNAVFEALDVGDFTATNIRTEAVQNVFLVDNTASAVVASGVIRIEGSENLLLGSSNGHTFTNPQFININGANASNSMTVDTIIAEGNRIQSAAPSYCNTFSKTLSTGGNWKLIFQNNNWFFGCSTAVMTGDTSGIHVQARDEILPNAQAEFHGGMLGTQSLQGANGTIFNYNYNGTSLVQLQQDPVYHPDAPHIVSTDCGTSPAFVTGSNDRGGSIQVGTGTITSCKVTFGDAFSTGPAVVVGIAFNATGTATITGYPTAAGFFTITGANMQGSTYSWVIADSSN